MKNKKSKNSHPRTLKELIAIIQHYFKNTLRKNWSIFNGREFQERMSILDAQMRRLASNGMTKSKKRAASVSLRDEEELWEIIILESDNPCKLMNTLIYLLGWHLS